ncbi:MAG: phosphatidylserine decarboxylase [Deltaproteobacteria bacterium]|nr:phosphatidylserine decarboxylase [Deltaproteobacteria bacterium]
MNPVFFLVTLVAIPYTMILRILCRTTIPICLRKILARVCSALDIDLSKAKKKSFDDYESFLEVFIREPENVKIEDGSVVSPCEGTILQVDGINADGVLAKAKLSRLISQVRFSVESCLGIYLSVSDFHRVYSPVSGSVLSVERKGICLGSVNPKNKIWYLDDALFLNKRVFVYFSTDQLGAICMILVGALGVSRIVFSEKFQREYHLGNFLKGDEIARFELGSFVWLLFERKMVFTKKVFEKVSIGQALVLG